MPSTTDHSIWEGISKGTKRKFLSTCFVDVKLNNFTILVGVNTRAFIFNKNNSNSRIRFHFNKLQYFFLFFTFVSDLTSALGTDELDLYAFSIYHVAKVYFSNLIYWFYMRRPPGKWRNSLLFILSHRNLFHTSEDIHGCMSRLFGPREIDLNAAHNLRTYNYLLKIILTSRWWCFQC